MLGHLLDDLFGKSSRLGGCADQDVGLDLLYNAQKIIVVFALPFRIFTGIRDLSWSELIFLRLDKESWLVNTPILN